MLLPFVTVFPVVSKDGEGFGKAKLRSPLWDRLALEFVAKLPGAIV